MNAAVDRKVRWATARNDDGSEVFVPWHPFSRTAWVIPTSEARAALQRRARLYMVGWVAVIVAIGVTGRRLGFSPLVIPLLIPLAVAHWALWVRRCTRGLERTRYQEPTG